MEEFDATSGVVAVLQARMYSRRVPGKPLRPLGDATVLEQVIRRMRATRFGARLVVATSDDPSDTPIRELCAMQNIACFAGSRKDVLDRIISAARAFDATLVVRCTLNNVLLDPRMFDACPIYALRSDMDYVLVNRLPEGVTVDAMPIRTLHRIADMTTDARHREAVVSFVHANPDFFERARLPAPPRLARPDIRLALETEDDYRFLKRLYADVVPRANGLINLEDAIAYSDTVRPTVTIYPLSEALRRAA
jgi:spore coat polysaccharide biosynthesis protein SpsF (cytidylyltransferase family)